MFDIPQEAVTIQPVGVVVSDFKKVDRQYDYNNESMIFLREDLMEALTGIEYFSHIHVVYYQHRRQDWIEMTGNKPSLTLPFAGEPARQGLYSTRSPARPSGLGYCVVELIRIEQNRLYVRGLDAIDGSPVLDIKVYVPEFDAVPFAETPLNWFKGSKLKPTSRAFHWDTINVGLALGLKAGAKALQVLGISRGKALSAEVFGGHFFAQGIEGATGCSILRNNMVFEETLKSIGEWKLKLTSLDNEVEIRLNDNFYAEAGEVLALAEHMLFSSVIQNPK